MFVLGVLYPYRCTDRVKFGMEEWNFGLLLHAKFYPHQYNGTCRPCGAKNFKNRPLNNYLRFALRPMLPVTILGR